METLCLSSAALGVGLLRSEKVAVECSVLLSMMVNILRTMARSSPGGTSDSQLGGWPVTPLIEKRSHCLIIQNLGRFCRHASSCCVAQFAHCVHL